MTCEGAPEAVEGSRAPSKEMQHCLGLESTSAHFLILSGFLLKSLQYSYVVLPLLSWTLSIDPLLYSRLDLSPSQPRLTDRQGLNAQEENEKMKAPAM